MQCSAVQCSAAVARRVERVGRMGGAVFASVLLRSGLATLADATMAEGRAGLGRGELSGGQAGLLYVYACIFIHAAIPTASGLA